jgi:hypothetical protein
MTLDEVKVVVIANASSFGGDGMRAVNDTAIVDELRRTGMSEADARMQGREAVAEMGGYIERMSKMGGLRPGGPRRRHWEVWTVPEAIIRRNRARAA